MTTTEQIFKRIQEGIEASDLSLHKLAEKAGVNYHRLYRFHRGESELPLEDADRMFKLLTGKSFIKNPS